ncbi:hypothetical protein CHS0354_033049 [Potamilus streckersoni]|uniref:Uncharacterized protein n=1 Tax=Potamilus streckersoni TaxID=2493646 RepID=A0AAE0VKJ2_9BIVA|nr:hypothetical protein CHS0354_033049 [Potamilus streckersoni]
MNLFEIISTPDAVITKREKRSKKKIQERTSVGISTGDFTEREYTANSLKKNEYNPSTEDITNIDETRNSSNNIVNGEPTEGSCESSDIKAETKKKRKKKHRRHGEDRQDEETVQSLNRKSEKKKKKKKRQHETEMGDLLQKEFVQDNDRKEERKIKLHRKDEEDLLQSESVEDVDTKKDKRKKKKKKHNKDVGKELKDECVDDEVNGEENKRKQKKHPMDSKDVSQGESIIDVDVIADFNTNLKDKTEIKDELNVGSSFILEEKMENKNNTEKHENDNEKKLQCESIDGINMKPVMKKKKKRKHRSGIFEEKTQNESAEVGKEMQKEKRHDFLQRKQDIVRKEEREIELNGEEMDNDKAKGSTSLSDLANDISESEVVSSDDVAYRSEKKQKMKKKKKQPSQEVEREHTQTIDDIVELDVKRKKRTKRHIMAPIKQLDSSDEDVVMTRNREGK